MQSQNHITEINVHTGLRGWWQKRQYKRLLLKKLKKSKTFVAIPIEVDGVHLKHIEILLQDMNPAQAEQILQIAHEQLRGQRIAAEGAKNILNNPN